MTHRLLSNETGAFYGEFDHFAHSAVSLSTRSIQFETVELQAMIAAFSILSLIQNNWAKRGYRGCVKLIHQRRAFNTLAGLYEFNNQVAEFAAGIDINTPSPFLAF